MAGVTIEASSGAPMANLLQLVASSSLPVHLGVLLLQFTGAVTTILTQALLEAGVDNLVLGSYCFLLAALFLGSISFFIERRNNLKLTLHFIPMVLLMGLLMYAIQFLGLVGLSNTSAGFVAAMHPTTPIFTAMFSVVAGVESLNIWKYDGQIKLSGILTCISGAVLMSAYSGPCIICSSSSQVVHTTPTPEDSGQNFALGALCVVGSSMIIAALGVGAAKVVNRPVATLTGLSLTFGVGGLISGASAFFTLDKSAWIISLRLIPLVFIISICSLTLIPVLAMWGLRRLGPTTVSCYQPFNTIITMVLSVIYMGSSIFLGSIIGASLIVIGLVLVSWAQEKRLRLASKEPGPQEEDLEARLLPSPESSDKE